MEINKILWPIDFSANSAKALDHVRSLAEKYAAEIHVLFVIEDLGHPEDPWYGELKNTRVEELKAWQKEKAKEHLDQVCDNHLEGCPLFFKHIAVGDPARKILDFAKEEGIDMIVLGTKGKSDDFGFGSTADKVVKNSEVPVACVPGGC